MQNLPFDHLFCNFIPGQSLSGKLDALVIEHAELSREERTLTLWLFSETYLTQKDEATLTDGLRAQYGLRRVELNLRFPEALFPRPCAGLYQGLLPCCRKSCGGKIRA